MSAADSHRKEMYWRVVRDVQEGSLSWRKGWLVGRPAPGLMEIADTPGGLTGVVMSESEIVFKFTKEPA